LVVTRERKRNKGIDMRIGKANAVLRELYHSVVTKREVSNTAKHTVYKSVFVLILTYGHGSGAMTERVLFQVQVRERGFAESSRRDTSRQSAQL